MEDLERRGYGLEHAHERLRVVDGRAEVQAAQGAARAREEGYGRLRRDAVTADDSEVDEVGERDRVKERVGVEGDGVDGEEFERGVCDGGQ